MAAAIYSHPSASKRPGNNGSFTKISPAPRRRKKHDTVPARNILVLGDAMADWLAYGLEDTYSDQPDFGISRRHKTVSGLIRYQPKGDPADWAAAAKDILATEKPDVIVVMLGLSDRTQIHEPAGDKSDDKKKKDARSKPNESNNTAAKPDDKDSELSPDDADNGDAPPSIAPKRARVRRTEFTSFARSAGSSSTTRRSTR